jgi:hypothetical protein
MKLYVKQISSRKRSMKGSTTYEIIPYRIFHANNSPGLDRSFYKKKVSLMGSNNGSISIKVVFIN